ncbi:MAG: LysR family transcriptional regulator [Chloracidobacterium sp.]|nr:LysR family transcriptional regulator [Chloracidobacterium sp.]MCC6826024.1 LysR family transcriptional regulator [Acidobacteriota bacterium]MCO5334413.1 LysR family transcriptional regulator [Pyrinomonadaceae bacterium]
MDINQLEVILTVARERSFSRAAEVLGRSQPAISQAVSRLEDQLGEVLFDRSSKDGTLTPAGEVLCEHAVEMLNIRRDALEALREMRLLRRGKVRISANEHTVFFLLPVIDKFLAEHPDIKIEVKRGVASRIPKAITAREAELGVISFTPDDDTINSIEVVTDELVLVVAPDHHLAGGKQVSIAELGSESFIAHNAASPYRQKVITAFEKHKTPLNISVELPSLEAIKRLVERGVGVALIPRLTAESEINAGILSALTVPEMRLERTLNVIYRRNTSLSAAAEAFLEVCRGLQSERPSVRRKAF